MLDNFDFSKMFKTYLKEFDEDMTLSDMKKLYDFYHKGLSSLSSEDVSLEFDFVSSGIELNQLYLKFGKYVFETYIIKKFEKSGKPSDEEV